MKILFLAPQPFFQERGTPIAVRLALEVLSKRGGDDVDLVTYHEGLPVSLPNVTIHRIPSLPGLRGIRPGISFKKILCDLLLALVAIRLAAKNRYQVVHAVEEAVFVARLIRFIFGVPYVYDMDSSLALQLTEKWWVLRPCLPLLERLERGVVRKSVAVVPVCDALAVIAERHGSPHTQILRDISLLEMQEGAEGTADATEDLRAGLGLPASCLLILYSGNLESYQGIDLLIDSFARVAPSHRDCHLVIIGGAPEHIAFYRQKAAQLDLTAQVHFPGPRPVALLRHFLAQADVVVSPRTKGNNTPMKIYSYLHSGKALVATALPTHTQVISEGVALLAAPTAEEFGAALRAVIADGALRDSLGAAAYRLAEEKYTYPVFERSLNALYDHLETRPDTAAPTANGAETGAPAKVAGQGGR